jgi:hypothetical protein
MSIHPLCSLPQTWLYEDMCTNILSALFIKPNTGSNSNVHQLVNVFFLMWFVFGIELYSVLKRKRKNYWYMPQHEGASDKCVKWKMFDAKTIYLLIPFIWNVGERKISSDRKQTGGYAWGRQKGLTKGAWGTFCSDRRMILKRIVVICDTIQHIYQNYWLVKVE